MEEIGLACRATNYFLTESLSTLGLATGRNLAGSHAVYPDLLIDHVLAVHGHLSFYAWSCFLFFSSSPHPTSWQSLKVSLREVCDIGTLVLSNRLVNYGKIRRYEETSTIRERFCVGEMDSKAYRKNRTRLRPSGYCRL